MSRDQNRTTLQLRAQILAKIRAFFTRRNILEVETPLLSHSTNPAPHLHSFATTYQKKNLYLQTSPEFAMKRLLASGSGDIYQICKAFRDGEQGRLHNPEFTLLEWYRINFNHHQLMDEMEQFLHFILNTPAAERITYRELFLQHLNVDPFGETNELKKIALAKGLDANLTNDHDTWLQLLLTHFIEPNLGQKQPVFVYDFPASQAMLAKINSDNPKIAERFEVSFKGIELANGFHELNDAQEQRQRFTAENKMRTQLNLPIIPLDENFLEALPHLPPCAGVAVGIDRLIMLATQTKSLVEVITFPIGYA